MQRPLGLGQRRPQRHVGLARQLHHLIRGPSKQLTQRREPHAPVDAVEQRRAGGGLEPRQCPCKRRLTGSRCPRRLADAAGRRDQAKRPQILQLVLAALAHADLRARSKPGTQRSDRHAVVRTRLADGDVDGARAALQDTLVRLELRVAEIPEETLRQSYLGRADNRELLALAHRIGCSRDEPLVTRR